MLTPEVYLIATSISKLLLCTHQIYISYTVGHYLEVTAFTAGGCHPWRKTLTRVSKGQPAPGGVSSGVSQQYLVLSGGPSISSRDDDGARILNVEEMANSSAGRCCAAFFFNCLGVLEGDQTAAARPGCVPGLRVHACNA